MDSGATIEILVWHPGWMKAIRILYRVRQFWDALRRKPLTTEELAPTLSVLTEKQMALFTRLQPSEQTHALRVLRTLLEKGETHPDLMTAALLHDIGKSCHPLRLWERVVIVLGKKLFPERLQSWGRGEPRGWARPFVVASEHPLWGAELSQKAGTSPLVVHLIRAHQNELPPKEFSTLENQLLSLLQEADRQN
jgi:hypothetical protein